jgi:penicillin-binding protein 2
MEKITLFFLVLRQKINPKIAIAVFVENAGFGATYAAPIASLMVEKYLNDTIAKKRKAIEERMFKAKLIKDMEVGIPKTPEQLRQDSLAKVKAKNDRIKFVEDSIKTAKQKSKDQKEKAETVILLPLIEKKKRFFRNDSAK